MKDAIPQQAFEAIENRISSDQSVVGIDAKKTHIIIIHMLGEIQEKLDTLDKRLAAIEQKQEGE